MSDHVDKQEPISDDITDRIVNREDDLADSIRKRVLPESKKAQCPALRYFCEFP